MGHEHNSVKTMDIHTLEAQDFEQLPLVVEGESKEVRYAGNGNVVIRLKPTIYSYTHNRTGTIAGSDTLRLKAIQQLLPCIEALGLKHSYIDVTNKWILSKLVLQPPTEQGYQFLPPDLTREQINALPKAPPIEVIAKARHTGTSKHRYYNFGAYPTRHGQSIAAEEAYPQTVIRFDWRNPMNHPQTGERLADEILPETIANWFIDTGRAKHTATIAFEGLRSFLETKQLELVDMCFFISEDGELLFGEISPDCMRVRAHDGSSLDKDVWRQGGSSDRVLQKWQEFVQIVGEPASLPKTNG